MLAEKFGRHDVGAFLAEMSPGLRTYWTAFIAIQAKEARSTDEDTYLPPDEALTVLKQLPGARIDGG